MDISPKFMQSLLGTPVTTNWLDSKEKKSIKMLNLDCCDRMGKRLREVYTKYIIKLFSLSHLYSTIISEKVYNSRAYFVQS